MKNVSLTTILLAVACCSVTAYSQSFISKLPADGIGVTYENEFVNPNREPPHTRSVITIRCVGTKKTDDAVYRWIEIQTQYEKFLGSKDLEKGKSVTKFLVNEKELGKNGKGLLAVAESVLTVNTRQKQTSTPYTPAYPFALDFYQPAYEKSEPAESNSIKALGRVFRCKATSFTVRIDKDRDERGPKGTTRKYTVYTSDEAPFGCVEMRIDLTSPKGEKRVRTIKLKSVFMNAKAFIKE